MRSLFDGIPQQGAALGDPHAPVTLVEYADLQCPYCAQWARETLPVIASEYVRSGRVRIVFRGLAFLGADSEVALRAVVGAGAQNKLWNLLDALYARQGMENAGWVGEQLPDALAAVRGLDAREVERVGLASSTDREMLRAARVAEAAGVSGTPSFQVGRTGGHLRLVRPESLSAEALRRSLDAALSL